MANEKKSYDKRTIDRYVQKGKISSDEYKKHVQGLPDDSANAEWVDLNLEETLDSED